MDIKVCMCLPGTSSSSSSISSDFGALLSNTIKRNLVVSLHDTESGTLSQQNTNHTCEKSKHFPNRDKYTNDQALTVNSMTKTCPWGHCDSKALAEPFSDAKGYKEFAKIK